MGAIKMGGRKVGTYYISEKGELEIILSEDLTSDEREAIFVEMINSHEEDPFCFRTDPDTYGVLETEELMKEINALRNK
jgi:hypothetical protein